MKVFIVGLGLIGASYAAKLNENHNVYGYDQSPSVISKALNQKLIIDSDLSHITSSDVVILALYPQAIITFLKEHLALFNANQVITDVSGTKEKLLDAIDQILPKDFTYISHHPMAGREKGGFDQHDKNLFSQASVIIINEKSNDKGLSVLKQLFHDLAFKTIVETNRHHHDERIAFTSQLPHALALALMHMSDDKEVLSFSGNSFKDLTRIASINNILWSSLFLENGNALNHEIDSMITHLTRIKSFINDNNKEALMTYMATAKERRDRYEEDSN